MNPYYGSLLPPSLHAPFERAAALAGKGDWHAAADLCLRLHDSAPDCIPVLLLGSLASLRASRYRQAHALALELSALSLPSPDILLEAVRTLRRFEEPAALQRLVSRSDWRGARSAPLLTELALHLGSSGLYAPAFECLDVAVHIAPTDPNVHYLRGLFEMFTGNTEASIAALRRSLALHAGMANAHWLLAMQQEVASADAHVQEMQRALAFTRPDSEAEIYLRYALHHRLHSLGRHGEAWASLERGLVMKRRATPYDRSSQHALFESLKRMTTRDVQAAPVRDDGTGLIFIVGMYRSGTTLVERVLAGHPDVTDGGETYQFSAAMRQATDYDCLDVVDAGIVARSPSADFRVVGRRMHAFADWRGGGGGLLTEKLPSNFLNIGFILQALPDARIVHMRRDPVETCFSNLRTIFNGAAPYACAQEDLAGYYLQYEALMAHWHERAPGKILDVDYSALVENPASESRRIMEYCGLPYAPEALEIARHGGITATASASDVRKGILKNRGQAWKPYAGYLEPLIQGLQTAR